jgi:RNA-binding protein YhbY
MQTIKVKLFGADKYDLIQQINTLQLACTNCEILEALGNTAILLLTIDISEKINPLFLINLN